MVLDPCQGSKQTLVSHIKHASSNPAGGIFITYLNKVSLLKKLFFMHKQS